MRQRASPSTVNASRTRPSNTASRLANKPAGPHVSGLIQGGLGGPDDELLKSGQEEVFSRTEVETGRIEHKSGEDAATPPICHMTLPQDDRT